MIGYYTISIHITFLRYAGVLYGISNFISTVPGIVAPEVTGALTPNVSPPVENDMLLFRNNSLVLVEGKSTRQEFIQQ